ncbi:hypothetical protein [Sanguibacter sp. HDW7]|uniref:hypothetical protein n=1 Tax=Sanguibacter sp. HDW7 TaxID=2714931 RepID=UPI00140B3F46|nr:hypothetical protein [Sanguibacter sp. HDW7]QIK83004.1 hypothetical protein G7063_04700 [Sanguibacter sp. HDW7]
MKTMPRCERCDRKHSLYRGTYAVGLFSLLVPLYRADYDGSPRRATRAEANADMCDHYATLPKEPS